MYKLSGFLIVVLMLGACREQPVSNQAMSPPTVTLDSVSSGTTHTLRSVSFPSIDTGYIVGDTGALVRTYSAGSSWSSSAIEPGRLNSVFFWSDTEGLVGGQGFILHTKNGLASWDSVRLGGVVYSLGGAPNGWLLAGMHAWGGGVSASSDTGMSWHDLACPFKNAPVSAFAVQGGHWVASVLWLSRDWSTGGGMSYSTNPDSSWQDSHDGGGWNCVSMDASGNAVAVGDTGGLNGSFPQTLWSTDFGQTWTSVSPGITSFLNGVAISSSGNIVAVGDSAILTSTVGSQSWTKLAVPAYPLNAVTFSSPTKAVAVGEDGKIYTITFGSP